MKVPSVYFLTEENSKKTNESIQRFSPMLIRNLQSFLLCNKIFQNFGFLTTIVLNNETFKFLNYFIPYFRVIKKSIDWFRYRKYDLLFNYYLKQNYRSMRYKRGLPVRGQRTRSNYKTVFFKTFPLKKQRRRKKKTKKKVYRFRITYV